VFRIHALIKLYQFVLDQGELEHTSDWDWRITVMHGAPSAMGTYSGYHMGSDDKDYSDAVMCDTIELDYETEPEDYTSHFSRWEFLTIEEFHGDQNEATTVRVPIDHIRTISIGYDT
jgi:hypothetical protein